MPIVSRAVQSVIDDDVNGLERFKSLCTETNPDTNVYQYMSEVYDDLLKRVFIWNKDKLIEDSIKRQEAKNVKLPK